MKLQINIVNLLSYMISSNKKNHEKQIVQGIFYDIEFIHCPDTYSSLSDKMKHLSVTFIPEA